MKLKDLFQLNPSAVLPAADRVYKRAIGRRKKTIGAIAAGCSACVVLIAVSVALLLRGTGGIGAPVPVVSGTVNVIDTVIPAEQSGAGTKLSSSLKITTTEDVAASELKARITVSPEAEYSVRKTGECSYEVNFKDDLTADTLYNLSAVYNGKTVYRWAFQTETVFCVTSVTPENEHYVSADSAVEVTFSHAEVTGFEDAFEIFPSIKGTFEHYGRTWAFVPAEPMKPATLYTVTVNKEVMGPEGLALKDDYRFSFTTTPENTYAYLIYQQNEVADTFLADEAPMAAICYENVNAAEASVEVYRFADSGAYIDAYKKYVRNGEVSPEITELGLEPHTRFSTTPILTDNYYIYDKAAFIYYPEPLPLGYYFAEIQMGGIKMYQLLESTTLSVYTLTTNGDYNIWVNNTQTGEPVSGATVTLEGFRAGRTGSTGIAAFEDAGTEMKQRVLTVENGEYPYVAVLNGGAEDTELSVQNDYFSYISTGSRLYRANDTVRVFGVVLPRKSGVSIPKNAVLTCDFTDQKYSVELDSNGSFTAEIPLNNTAAEYGDIALTVKDISLTSTYFTIADYELPTYAVSVQTDKLAYQAGEQVAVTARVNYMDGTPAAGVYLAESQGDQEGYTDENGILSGTLPAKLSDIEYFADSNHPDVASLEFRTDTGTDADCWGDAQYLVFGGDQFLQGNYENGDLTVTANTVDLTLAEQYDADEIYSYAYREESFIGSPATLKLTGDLHKITYNKIPAGTTYDAINKKVVYTWEYEEIDELVRSFELDVADGTGTLPISDATNTEADYYVLLYLEGEVDTPAIKVYLSDLNNANPDQRSYYIDADQTTLDIGEKAVLSVRQGSNNELITSGSVFYTAVCGEITDTFYSISSRYSIEFKKEYAPDILVYGAYFDGKHVFSLGNILLDYNTDHARLEIEMEKDMEEYHPGDEVNLKFKVTDDNGDPVSAMLNISVLDRGLYIMGGEFDDPTYELYGFRSYDTAIYTTCSHREFLYEYGYGGGGGGGDSQLRNDFEDTPYFENLRTDSNGYATATFTLPDSITEWKVVARAVSKDVKVGMENFSLRSTQDFFAQVAMGDSIKETDDFTVAVKGEGRKLDADASCTMQVGLTDQDGNDLKTLTATVEKSQYAYLNFGALKAGIYTLYVHAESGDLKDDVVKTLTVEQNQSTAWIHHQQPVDGGISLNLKPRRGNVTLTVVDEQLEFWQRAMARLRSSAGTRVDQVLGRYLADLFYTGGGWMDETKMDHTILRPYLTYEGINLMPDSDFSDLRITAKMAAVAADFCVKEDLQYTFEKYLNDRYAARVDVLTAYFGLAALGEPVLADLQTLYGAYNDFTPEEYAYLALGFAYCGDYTTAQYIYDNTLKE